MNAGLAACEEIIKRGGRGCEQVTGTAARKVGIAHQNRTMRPGQSDSACCSNWSAGRTPLQPSTPCRQDTLAAIPRRVAATLLSRRSLKSRRVPRSIATSSIIVYHVVACLTVRVLIKQPRLDTHLAPNHLPTNESGSLRQSEPAPVDPRVVFRHYAVRTTFSGQGCRPEVPQSLPT